MRQKARKWMLQGEGGENQVGKEDIKIKLRLFETCLMTTLTYRMKVWGNIRPGEMREKQKITERH